MEGWDTPPAETDRAWAGLADEFKEICEAHPRIKNTNNYKQPGNAGNGNHFNRNLPGRTPVGAGDAAPALRGWERHRHSTSSKLAKKDAEMNQRNPPDKDLAY